MDTRTRTALTLVTAASLWGSAVFADVQAPSADVDQSTTAPAPAQSDAAVIYRGVNATVPATPRETPATPRERFEERLRQAQERQRQEEWDAAHRPTAWQLQNPSGGANHYSTDRGVTGYQAPNTYFGSQHRAWNQMSPPVYERAVAPNITPTTPLTQTSVMVAPYTWWGANNSTWNMITPANATPNPLGGWNTGWSR